MNVKKIVFKLGLTVTQICAFVFGIYGTGVGISYWGMVQYADGDVQRFRNMPIVLESDLGDSLKLSTIQWLEYSSNRESKIPENYRLHLQSGEIVPSNIEYNRYKFTVKNKAHEWIVVVEEFAETALIYWRYQVIDNKVVPVSRRVFSFVVSVVGVFPGLIFGWLVGLLGKAQLKRMGYG